jgi:hypothetical protein
MGDVMEGWQNKNKMGMELGWWEWRMEGWQTVRDFVKKEEPPDGQTGLNETER